MNETGQDATSTPEKRVQFPLWFLLFVIPTIAGLGFAIYTNGREQARASVDLLAQEAVLRDKIALLESEIARAQQVDQAVQWHADRWKSPEAVVDYFKSFHHNEESTEKAVYGFPFLHSIGAFFIQADEADLRRLLKLLREAYPTCDDSNKYSLLDFAIHIPTHAPSHVDALAEDARLLADVVPENARSELQQQAERLRRAFHLDKASQDEEIAR